MHTFLLTFNAIISGTIAADTAQMDNETELNTDSAGIDGTGGF
jgi:hypothetical protein